MDVELSHTEEEDSEFIKRQKMLIEIYEIVKRHRALIEIPFSDAEKNQILMLATRIASKTYKCQKSGLLNTNQLIRKHLPPGASEAEEIIYALEMARLHHCRQYESDLEFGEAIGEVLHNIKSIQTQLQQTHGQRWVHKIQVLEACQDFYDKTYGVYRVFQFSALNGKTAEFKGKTIKNLYSIFII